MLVESKRPNTPERNKYTKEENPLGLRKFLISDRRVT